MKTIWIAAVDQVWEYEVVSTRHDSYVVKWGGFYEQSFPFSKCWFSRREAEYHKMFLIIQRDKKIREELARNNILLNQVRDYLSMGVSI